MCALDSFVKRFVSGLFEEYILKGIRFQVQDTCLIKDNNSSFFTIYQSSREFVRNGIKCIGYGSEEIPFWLHKLLSYLALHLPMGTRIVRKIVERNESKDI